MIKETGRIVAIDPQYLWLETINRGTCGSCVAEKGCGQSLLARWMSSNSYLKVSLDGRAPEDYKLNDQVCVGVPDNLVVTSSMLIYCLPLFLLIVGAAVGQSILDSDLVAVIGAVMGLAVGALLVRVFSWVQRNNNAMRPIIIDLISNCNVLEL